MQQTRDGKLFNINIVRYKCAHTSIFSSRYKIQRSEWRNWEEVRILWMVDNMGMLKMPGRQVEIETLTVGELLVS